MDIKGKKIVLIGGAGLIGSHTLDYLVKEDVKEILIYDNMSRGSFENIQKQLIDPRVKLYEIGGDILQEDILNLHSKMQMVYFIFATAFTMS